MLEFVRKEEFETYQDYVYSKNREKEERMSGEKGDSSVDVYTTGGS